MVRRKLQALNYHSADTVDIHDPQQVRALVLWLEDQVIRNYKIEDRLGLRNLDSPSWTDAFRKYCTDIDCPISPDEQLECLDWITGYAVRLEYFDDPEKYSKQISQELINNKREAPTVTSVNPLDNLDFQSDEFRNGVNSLANLLKIAPHPNHLITLEAICALITNSMKDKDLKKEGHPFPVMETDLGFDLGDYVLNQAAKVLRLLYTHDLRDLQTKINECIVAVQSVTADPKTDTKLGKVGF
ncbi:RLL motif containing protein 1 [Nesidiocoris tenuis]|uniref:RLL motif containing protein 1 n=1 Tax=Nesidiocoris tenuis TaxID=355587 RepID=A0ABN7ATC1_9HEMI|nr:RLL motif containing protein 1 [Nesidiocoris tenuis]